MSAHPASSTDFPTALPDAGVDDPMQAPPLRWGVLAPGGIAHGFTESLRRHTRQQVVAVGSRSPDRAAAFAAEFGVANAYGDYRQLVDDPAVQVVYVASPHSEHRHHALLAIAAGKHVLVEKAFTRNASEAAEVAGAARAAGVFAMEAMWARFLPQAFVLRRLLADGVLGEVATVIADHGQYFTPGSVRRLFDPELAGGALLDLGIYPISFAHMVLGAPDSVVAVGTRTSTGVDEQVAAVLSTGRAQALVSATMTARTPTTATVSGSAARVELSGRFYAPGTLTLTARDGRTLVRQPGPIREHMGLCYEAAHLATMVAAGATESPVLPLDETVAIMATIDEMRRQVGVSLPGE